MKTFKSLRYCIIITLVSLHLMACGEGENITVRIADYKGDRAAAISYTFDDGMKEHYTLVAPEMDRRNIRGTFWINGISVGKDSDRVTWEELREMARAGHEISNHGWSHTNLTKISPEEVKVEIGRNDSIILAEIGIPSRTFCYPYNATNDTVLQLASANRVATRTRQYGIGTQSTTESLDQWVNTVLQKGDWGVAMIHGITRGYDAFTFSHHPVG